MEEGNKEAEVIDDDRKQNTRSNVSTRFSYACIYILRGLHSMVMLPICFVHC